MRRKHRGEAVRRLPILLGYILAGLTGLLLILYPLLSNYLYDIRQDGAIQEYQSNSGTSRGEAVCRAALEEARKYNRALLAGRDVEPEPFLLDLNGSGVIAVLTVPKLNLHLPVYYGTDVTTLERGIGLLERNSLPVGGEGSHAVLCGHSAFSAAKLFSDLEQMEIDDTFSLDVVGERLTYEVDQITVVLPEDFSRLAIEPDEDYCTLLTCTPFGVNTHRLLVRGTRVETPTEQPVTQVDNQPVRSVWVQEYLRALAVGGMLLVAIILTVALIAAYRRRHR